MTSQLVSIALAGAFGTLCRYTLSGLVQQVFGPGFPWGTLITNAVGCFLFALVWTMTEERMLLSTQTRFVVLTGFMGAFTTFSTFAHETGLLARDAEWSIAAVNLLSQNLLGLASVLAGWTVGRWL